MVTQIRGEGEHEEFFKRGKVPILTVSPDTPAVGTILFYAKMKAGNPVFYFQDENGLEKELGPGEFLNLSDTPAAFASAAGDALKMVRVNAAGDALEFFTHDGSGDPHEQYAFDYELFHDKERHNSAVLTGVDNEVLGPHYIEIEKGADVSSTPADSRRIYVGPVSDELFASTDVGDSISLDRPFPILTFPFPRKKLANEVFLPRPAYPVTNNILGPNVFDHQLFKAGCAVAAGGDGTLINLESATGNPFTTSPTWTLRAQVILDQLRFLSVTLGLTAWTYNPVSDWLRVRAESVYAAAPPEDVVAYFEWDFYR